MENNHRVGGIDAFSKMKLIKTVENENKQQQFFFILNYEPDRRKKQHVHTYEHKEKINF